MKKLFLSIFCLTIFLSCDKDDDDPFSNNPSNYVNYDGITYDFNGPSFIDDYGYWEEVESYNSELGFCSPNVYYNSDSNQLFAYDSLLTDHMLYFDLYYSSPILTSGTYLITSGDGPTESYGSLGIGTHNWDDDSGQEFEITYAELILDIDIINKSMTIDFTGISNENKDISGHIECSYYDSPWGNITSESASDFNNLNEVVKKKNTSRFLN